MKHFELDDVSKATFVFDAWTRITVFNKHTKDYTPPKRVVAKWCEENGSDMKYAYTIIYFYFENPKDATLFALRWA